MFLGNSHISPVIPSWYSLFSIMSWLTVSNAFSAKHVTWSFVTQIFHNLYYIRFILCIVEYKTNKMYLTIQDNYQNLRNKQDQPESFTIDFSDVGQSTSIESLEICLSCNILKISSALKSVFPGEKDNNIFDSTWQCHMYMYTPLYIYLILHVGQNYV